MAAVARRDAKRTDSSLPRTRREGLRTTLRLTPAIEMAAGRLQRGEGSLSRNEALLRLLALGAKELERRAELGAAIARRSRLWDQQTIEMYGLEALFGPEHPEQIADEQWDAWLSEADPAAGRG